MSRIKQLKYIFKIQIFKLKFYNAKPTLVDFFFCHGNKIQNIL